MTTKGHPLTFAVLDPRLLGMVVDSSPNLARATLESVLKRADRKVPSLARDMWKEELSWRIDYETLAGTPIRAWIVPGWAYAVARIEMRFAGPNGQYVDLVESTMGQFGRWKVWYPKQCVYRRLVDGKEMERELVSVDVASLNETLDPEVFKISGMSLPDNTPITGLDPKGGLLVWDGKGIRSRKADEFRLEISTSGEEGKVRDWLLIVGGVSALIGLAAGLQLYLQRRKQ